MLDKQQYTEVEQWTSDCYAQASRESISLDEDFAGNWFVDSQILHRLYSFNSKKARINVETSMKRTRR